MGKGGDANCKAKSAADEYSAIQVATHASYAQDKDSWLVYEGQVYNISNFAARHPGGWELITTYEGQDATAAMNAFHPDQTLLKKYLKPLHVGTCPEMKTLVDEDPVMQDFHVLTQQLQDEGMFEPKLSFFALIYVHTVALEALAWYLVVYCQAYNYNLFNIFTVPVGTLDILVALIQGTAVQQASWLAHDAGHKSIFGANERLNFWVQQLTFGCSVGASIQWWKDRHSRHHAKTNIYKKDPDIRGRGVVLFGDVQFQDAEAFIVKPLIPYQKMIFILYAVPAVATVLFVRPILWHMLVNVSVYDALFASTFYLKNGLLFYPHVGLAGCIRLYLGMRLVQSYIFTWVSQMSHIPKDIINDKPPSPSFNWVQMQCHGTLNIQGNWFNDWFTGHLNYQIEHHLWPRMPRHNYAQVAPRVQALCAKHNIDYQVLPHLFSGCTEVVNKIQQTATHFQEYHNSNKQMKSE